MNIEVFFKKQGILAIPITVSMHNGVEIFFKEKFNVQEDGSIKFYCDWPYNTLCYFDFSTNSDTITSNQITIARFIFDEFWDSIDLTYKGENLPIEDMSIANVIDSNGLFYIGTLRYTIPPRPLVNWVTGQ